MLRGPRRRVFAGAARHNAETPALPTEHSPSSRVRATPARHWKGLAQKLANHLFQSLDPKRVFIQTRDQAKLTPARFKKCFTPSNADLLQRLKTIRDERRANHQQLLHSPRCQLRQFMVGVELQPLAPP